MGTSFAPVFYEFFDLKLTFNMTNHTPFTWGIGVLGFWDLHGVSYRFHGFSCIFLHFMCIFRHFSHENDHNFCKNAANVMLWHWIVLTWYIACFSAICGHPSHPLRHVAWHGARSYRPHFRPFNNYNGIIYIIRCANLKWLGFWGFVYKNNFSLR